jgi:surface carbohydrate biosynthesis protein
MTRILCLVDSKNRDSFGAAILKHRLLQLDSSLDIQAVSFDLCHAAVELFRPHVLVLNHLIGRRNRDLANKVKRRGGLVVTIPTERPNADDQLDWYVREHEVDDMDLMLSWSEIMAQRVKNAVTTGNPRFDIYQQPYRRLINTKERFCERYNIDATKPLIGFMSSFPQSKFALRGAHWNKIDWQDLKVDTLPGREDPTAFAQQEYANLQTFRHWIRTVVHKFGNRFSYVAKSHPMCETREWDVFAAETGVHLIKSDYIFNVANACDMVVSRGDCLTHCDAWLLGKPSIHALIGDVCVSGAGKESLDYGNGSASTANELVKLLDQYFSGRSRRKALNSSDYLAKWGFSVEQSSVKCAKAIVRLVDEQQPKVNDITLNERVELNRLCQQHDIQHFAPSADRLGHWGKSASRHAINEWIQQIKQAEAS